MHFAAEYLALARRITLERPMPSEKQPLFISTVERFGAALEADPAVRATAVEYQNEGIYDSVKETHTLASRRVVLVIRLDSMQAVELPKAGFTPEEGDEGGLLIWSINYFDHRRAWEFAPAAVRLPFAQIEHYKRAQASRSTWRRLVDRVSHASTPLMCSYLPLLPEQIARLDPAMVDEIFHESNMDACWAALGALSALRCDAVHIGGNDVLRHGDGAPVDVFAGRAVASHRGGYSWKKDKGQKRRTMW